MIEECAQDEQLVGYLTVRPGTRALQIGPSVANPEAGPSLLRDACHCYADQQMFIDVPDGNVAASERAFSRKVRMV